MIYCYLDQVILSSFNHGSDKKYLLQTSPALLLVAKMIVWVWLINLSFAEQHFME